MIKLGQEFKICSEKAPDMINDLPSLMQFIIISNVNLWASSDLQAPTMSLSYLQLRLKQNEEDFARISGIDLDPNIKDVQKK